MSAETLRTTIVVWTISSTTHLRPKQHPVPQQEEGDKATVLATWILVGKVVFLHKSGGPLVACLSTSIWQMIWSQLGFTGLPKSKLANTVPGVSGVLASPASLASP
eukprot:3480395-Amphidinium_carterae.2